MQLRFQQNMGCWENHLLWFSPSDPELGLLKVPNCHFPALLGGYNPFSSVVKIEGKYKELNIARWTIVNRQHYTHKSLLPMGIIELWYFYSSFNPISQIFEKRRATLRMDEWNTMYKKGRKWKILKKKRKKREMKNLRTAEPDCVCFDSDKLYRTSNVYNGMAQNASESSRSNFIR